MSDRRAALALFAAGLGWGTTGLFVRLLGAHGLSVYELLFVRLMVAGIILVPVFFFRSQIRKENLGKLILFGVSTTCYYLGAIVAFRHLPMFVAALIIGSSPVLAWIVGAKDRRDTRTSLGVAMATIGLLMLVLSNDQVVGTSENLGLRALGIIGAISAAVITVINATALKRLAAAAPSPLQINVATIVIGGFVSAFLVTDFNDVVRVTENNLGLAIGFGVLATAIPGLAIAYASVRLKPQATSTVSIQLQVWAGIFGWIILNESLSPLQIVAAVFAVTGSWICTTAKA